MTKRLQTFKSWRYSHQCTPIDLAEAAFYYYGVNDEVQCFVCGGILYNWTGGLPLKEHLRWLPNCKFAQLKRDNPGLLVEIWDNPAVMALQDQFYSDNIIEKAFKKLIAQDILNPDAGELLSEVLELEAIEWNSNIDNDDSDEEDLYGCGSTAEEQEKTEETTPLTVIELQNATYKKIDIKERYKIVEKIVQLKKENKLLKREITCRLCPQKANAVFLPCGHLCVCLDCKLKRKDCAKCRTLVRGVVKVYFV